MNYVICMLCLIWAWNECPSDKTAPKEITLTSDDTKNWMNYFEFQRFYCLADKMPCNRKKDE